MRMLQHTARSLSYKCSLRVIKFSTIICTADFPKGEMISCLVVLFINPGPLSRPSTYLKLGVTQNRTNKYLQGSLHNCLSAKSRTFTIFLCVFFHHSGFSLVREIILISVLCKVLSLFGKSKKCSR